MCHAASYTPPRMQICINFLESKISIYIKKPKNVHCILCVALHFDAVIPFREIDFKESIVMLEDLFAHICLFRSCL